MTVTWEEYVQPPLGEANIKDIENLESTLGVKFPQDYVELILHNQGKYPSKETVVSGELSSSTFGPLFHILRDSSAEQQLYGLIDKWEKWSDIYENIIPIADSAGTGCFFAYDYRETNDHPPIVFIDVEEDPDDDDGILFVADSLTDLIAALQ